MHKQRKLILVASAIGIISTFLPWFTISAGAFTYSVSQSRNGFHNVGIVYFILMVAIALISLLGEHKEMLQKNLRLAVIGGGIFSLLFLTIYYNSAKDDMGAGFGFVNLSIGFGLILAFLTSIIITIIPFVLNQPGEGLGIDVLQLKSGVNSLQGSISNAANLISKKPNKMEELEKLITWRNEGKITVEEYKELKSKII